MKQLLPPSNVHLCDVFTMLTLPNLVLASVVVGVSSNSVTINSKSGYDVPQCLGQNSSFPHKTFSYVVSNAVSLNNSENVLLGHQSINETLTVSHVEDLTIRGGEETASTIKCTPISHPNRLGSGLVIKLARRVKVFNIKVKYCGTAQTVGNVEYNSAVCIISTLLTFSSMIHCSIKVLAEDYYSKM